MGLIKAAIGSLGGVLADQWKEFIYCDALSENVLVTKGQKRISSQGRSSNTGAEDNIISQGSRIAVNNGQCMIIVEQGRVVEVCDTPGEYTYDKSTEASIFVEGLNKEGIMKAFNKMRERFAFGGDTGKDQRVYYLNTKEIIGNKYGTAAGVPFRVVDNRIGLDMDIAVRCFGEYSYKIVNPVLFYSNVCANIEDNYTRDRIDGQLKSEVLSALQPAFAKISEMGIRYSAVPGHTEELSEALNDILSEKWVDLRGIQIVSFGVSSIKASEEDELMIKEIQRNYVLRDPAMAAAHLAGATATSMQGAATNPSGAMTGLMGMGMVQGMTGGSMAHLYAMGQQQQAAQAAAQAAAPASWTCSCGKVNTGKFCNECGAKKPEPKPSGNTWTCACGTVNTGKFCNECGAKKPAAPASWTCSCGTVNTGKFCNECGAKKPEGDGSWICPECGTKNTTKFCNECGTKKPEGDGSWICPECGTRNTTKFCNECGHKH